ncbi:MAG: hypothetical protein H7Y38_16620 [Armatimonadetes bacterium]|nr:hypothetical protein [Armatimonadota bacterium]
MMNQQQVDWLYSQFRTQGLEANVHSASARTDSNWLYVPVYVALKDAYRKAQILQEIEDAWKNQNVAPGTHLLLMPAAN